MSILVGPGEERSLFGCTWLSISEAQEELRLVRRSASMSNAEITRFSPSPGSEWIAAVFVAVGANGAK
jgi:hypothetical protein